MACISVTPQLASTEAFRVREVTTTVETTVGSLVGDGDVIPILGKI